MRVEAEIVDEPAAANRPPEEFFLDGVGIDPEAICLAQEHAPTMFGGLARHKRDDDRKCGLPVTALHVHVFATKYRRGFLSDRAHRILQQDFERVCVARSEVDRG